MPRASTEHGVIMAASVLNSERAVQARVFVVRAFVRLNQMLTPYKELSVKIDRPEEKVRENGICHYEASLFDLGRVWIGPILNPQHRLHISADRANSPHCIISYEHHVVRDSLRTEPEIIFLNPEFLRRNWVDELFGTHLPLTLLPRRVLVE